MTDEATELRGRQQALQAEANEVLAQLDLHRVLGDIGMSVLVGSAALGLMTWGDIDVTVVCKSLDEAAVLEAAAQPRLTDDAQLAILRIKTLWSRRPEYGSSVRSWDIYTAVVDDNVRDAGEFDRWLSRWQP